MNYAKISVFPHDHPSVKEAKAIVEKEALLSWVMLFEGARWWEVEWAAVAFSQANNAPIGLASLAPTDEEERNGPHIIGVWVHPYARRRGVGLQLLATLAGESHARYNAQPTVMGVTHPGASLLLKAVQHNISLTATVFPVLSSDLP